MVWPFKGDTSGETTDPKQDQQRREFRLSRYIIIGAFVFIGIMLGVHLITLQSAIKVTNGNITATNSLIDKIDTSNQTIFNILLPIFGAWVGVVVAFYFGSVQAKKAQDALTEQAKNAHETLIKAFSREDRKLSNITVEQSLRQYPSALKVSTVTLKDTLTKVMETFGDLSNVVVIDETSRPLGVLYKSDLLEIDEIKKNDISNKKYTDSKSLDSLIEQIAKEFVTKKKWDKNGINNYAKLQLNTTLLEAKNLMTQISDKINDLLGLVMDNGKLIGVISYDMILAYQQ